MLRHERLGRGCAATPQPGKAEASHLHPAQPQGATATSRAEQRCSVPTATTAGWSIPVLIIFCYTLWAFFAMRLSIYQLVGPRSKYKTKKNSTPKACVCRKCCFLTAQTWPQSRKVDPQHCAEQEQSPVHADVTLLGRAKANTQSEARLEDKHLSKKRIYLRNTFKKNNLKPTMASRYLPPLKLRLVLGLCVFARTTTQRNSNFLPKITSALWIQSRQPETSS